jgi:hypothetical protein
MFNKLISAFRTHKYRLQPCLQILAGNCDIHAEQHILFMNEMKSYEVQSGLKDLIQKIGEADTRISRYWYTIKGGGYLYNINNFL